METIHSAQTSEVALEAIISNVIQIPGVKVDRKKFLADTFAKEKVDMQKLLDLGPPKLVPRAQSGHRAVHF